MIKDNFNVLDVSDEEFVNRMYDTYEEFKHRMYNNEFINRLNQEESEEYLEKLDIIFPSKEFIEEHNITFSKTPYVVEINNRTKYTSTEKVIVYNPFNKSHLFDIMLKEFDFVYAIRPVKMYLGVEKVIRTKEAGSVDYVYEEDVEYTPVFQFHASIIGTLKDYKKEPSSLL